MTNKLDLTENKIQKHTQKETKPISTGPSSPVRTAHLSVTRYAAKILLQDGPSLFSKSNR